MAARAFSCATARNASAACDRWARRQTSVTCLLRDTPAMGLLLAAHLGVVFALFITLPYGKFVHGAFRFAALVRYARERQAMAQGTMME